MMPKWVDKLDQYSDSTAIELVGAALLIAWEALESIDEYWNGGKESAVDAAEENIVRAKEALRRIEELGK